MVPYRGTDFGPIRHLLPVLRLCNFFAHIYRVSVKFSSHFFQRTLIVDFWTFVCSLNWWSHIVGSNFGPIRHLLPVLRLCNFFAHRVSVKFSSHFFQRLLIVDFWNFVCSLNWWSHIVGSDFGPIRLLLPVLRLCNFFAHSPRSVLNFCQIFFRDY